MKKKPTTKTPNQQNPNHICFEIFGTEFHLYLGKVIVVEINFFTFNVQLFNKKSMNLFRFFLNETHFCSAYSKFDLVDLIRKKICHDRRNRLAVQERKYTLD